MDGWMWIELVGGITLFVGGFALLGEARRRGAQEPARPEIEPVEAEDA